jgi:hypothetical protein
MILYISIGGSVKRYPKSTIHHPLSIPSAL